MGQKERHLGAARDSGPTPTRSGAADARLPLPAWIRAAHRRNIVQESRMKWILDRILLVITAVFLAAASWGFYHYTGQWGAPILLTIAFIGLLADNYRLRKLLRDNGIDFRSERRKRWEQRHGRTGR
jgi:hypothetical protein